MIFPGTPDVFGENHAPVPLFSTTNLTWNAPGSNLGLRDGRSVTNRLRTFQLVKQFIIS
jgi:hypothetical protein